MYIFKPIQMFVTETIASIYDESMSLYEAVAKLMGAVNTAGENITGLFNETEKKEYSSDITIKRKLSPLGNFTGTIAGRTIISIFSDINDGLSLCRELIAMINSNTSIGKIYDGGFFTDVVFDGSIDGGVF